MSIKNYDDLNLLELDTLREIGSIGSGNAATALSSLLDKEVRITLPEVRIMEYNEAITWIGGPEVITAGVVVRLSGDMSGIMLGVLQMDFVNVLLTSMMGKSIDCYEGLNEIDFSALTEAGNIMISSFITAFTGLADMTIDLTVPSFTVDMQGAILMVPMAEYGGATNYIMTIGSEFICDDKVVPCRLLMSPDIRSLNFLLRKLGVTDE
ncbi:MAG: chemotaxis protein CheC [Eubacteriales bacterium]